MRLQYLHYLLLVVPLSFTGIYPGFKRFSLSKVSAVRPLNSLQDTVEEEILVYTVIVCVLPCILQSCIRSPECLCHEVELPWDLLNVFWSTPQMSAAISVVSALQGSAFKK